MYVAIQRSPKRWPLPQVGIPALTLAQWVTIKAATTPQALARCQLATTGAVYISMVTKPISGVLPRMEALLLTVFMSFPIVLTRSSH